MGANPQVLAERFPPPASVTAQREGKEASRACPQNVVVEPPRSSAMAQGIVAGADRQLLRLEGCVKIYMHLDCDSICRHHAPPSAMERISLTVSWGFSILARLPRDVFRGPTLPAPLRERSQRILSPTRVPPQCAGIDPLPRATPASLSTAARPRHHRRGRAALSRSRRPLRRPSVHPPRRCPAATPAGTTADRA